MTNQPYVYSLTGQQKRVTGLRERRTDKERRNKELVGYRNAKLAHQQFQSTRETVDETKQLIRTFVLSLSLNVDMAFGGDYAVISHFVFYVPSIAVSLSPRCL